MKNIKILLVSIVLSLFIPFTTYAATMEIQGDEKDNIGTYNLYYNGTEEDGTNLKFDVVSNTNVKPVIKKDTTMTGPECENGSCVLELPSNYTFGEKIKIATFTLTNTASEETIINLVVNMNGTKMTEKTGIKLSAGETTTVKAKSNNSSMSSITLSVGALDKTFDSNVTDYTVTGIKDTINSITLTPTCDNCRFTVTCPTGGCSVSNSKRVSLQTGANNVAVNIVSEDGSSNKTYMFNIYRGDVITSSPYLDELNIKDAVLSPTFNQLTNDYTTSVKNEVTELDITTVTEDPSAKVEIKGDKDLKEGENTLTITVTSSDGENKQVYTIIVTREEKEEKTTKKIVTKKVTKKKNNKWLILIISVVALAIIITSFILIFKKKKKKKNNDNDKNNKSNSENEEENSELTEENNIIKENTDALNILEETQRKMNEESKDDIDDALDDLMKTKKLELGDLDLYK